MKQALQLKLSQHLALTPQLQQSIKLLQLSTIELEQEIENFIVENPLLERDEDDGSGTATPSEPGTAPAVDGAASETFEATDSAPDSGAEAGGDAEFDSAPDNSEREADIERDFAIEAEWSDESSGSYPSAGAQDDDEFDPQDVQPATTSLRDHLNSQLGVISLPDRDRWLVQLLIESLDDDGYLTQSLEELAASLPEEFELDPDELSIALKHLQHFDPTGVGARNARECLLLQTQALPPDATRDLAIRIIRDCLDLLANRDFNKIKKATGCSDDELRLAHFLIKSLNPRPGAQYGHVDTRYITPDVIVRKTRGKWTATINPDVFPRLRINRLYADILSRQRRGEGGGLTGQLQEARWLIKNVQQRFDTIQRVTQAIVERQRQFFEHGEVAMRPLVLREIAEVCELHESTISRVTTQKYMATPRGIFELKYFFGSHVATEAGGACSATAIRALIKQLVGSENTKKTLSDNQIADILGQQGIVVARRTIAKYRESLGIPAANLRKSI
jgi:RNA polymerase sigma-54 factor